VCTHVSMGAHVHASTGAHVHASTGAHVHVSMGAHVHGCTCAREHGCTLYNLYIFANIFYATYLSCIQTRGLSDGTGKK
jgi:hypothetical protein